VNGVVGTSTRRRRIALAVATLPILVLTLTPSPTYSSDPVSVWCVVCGWRGASDALLNVALFVPFGIAIGALGLRARTALAIGCAFSIGIELSQFLIPNRYPGLGDVIYNGAGATLGVILYTLREWLFVPTGLRQARRRTWCWGAAGLLGLTLQAWLLAPAIPEREHRLDWTPPTEWGFTYGGQVLRFSVGGEALPPGPVARSAALVDALRRGTELELLVRAAPTPDGIAHLLVLTDDSEHEDLLIGLDHEDIVIRYRTRAMTLRLDRPVVRWRRGAARWATGDTISLRVAGIGGGLSISQRGGTAVAEYPGTRRTFTELRVPTGRGWGFLMFPRFVARRSVSGLDALWMLLLAFPLGVWGAGRTAVACGLSWVAALVLLPLAFPLLGPSFAGAFGVAAGITLGLVARFVHGNPEPFKWWEPLHTIFDPELAGPGSDDEKSG